MLAAAVLVGIAGGLGVYTFVYAKGCSYLTNDPAACANCHVMNEQYDGWLKASHRSVAVCNDCHAPHDFVGKYCTKARNGFWHSYYFTTGRRSRSRSGRRPTSRAIAEANCRRCHGPSCRRWARPSHAGQRRDLLHPLPRLGRATWSCSRRTSRIEVRGHG